MNQNPNRPPQQNRTSPQPNRQPSNRPNLPPNMTPQQRAEYFRRLEAQRLAQQKRQGSDQSLKYRKRKRAKLNVGLLLFAVIILIVVIISVYQITKNPTGSAETDNLFGGLQDMTSSVESTDVPETEVGSAETEESSAAIPHVSVSVNSADINQGDLILVNYQYAYSLADSVATVELYGNKTSYNLSNLNHRLTRPALTAINTMAEAFTAATGQSEMLVVSSYRTTADQQAIYDSKLATEGEEYAKNYVALPGYSEHHTGMAVDLSFYRASDGATIPVADHEFGSWLTDHGAEYGFILRYPEDKTNITRIAYEPWHFRYVGCPHAAVIKRVDLCLEEYIGLLKDYTFEGTILHVLADGTTAEVTDGVLPATGYAVYYVPVSAAEMTEIPIPEGYNSYSISGNNADGFIVTVTLGQ